MKEEYEQRGLDNGLLNFDNNNISFENVQVTIPQYAEPGTWKLSWVDAQDSAGNWTYFHIDSQGNYIENLSEYFSDLGIKTEFEVINDNPDTTPPELNNFDVTYGDAISDFTLIYRCLVAY